jgi:hypothetical protein
MFISKDQYKNMRENVYRIFADLVYGPGFEKNASGFDIPMVDIRGKMSIPQFEYMAEGDYVENVQAIIGFAYDITDMQRNYNVDPWNGGTPAQIFRLSDSTILLCQWDWNSDIQNGDPLLGKGAILKIEEDQYRLVTLFAFNMM